jgi:hypothetical protein
VYYESREYDYNDGHKTLLGNITKMIGKENMGIRFMKALKELLRSIGSGFKHMDEI